MISGMAISFNIAFESRT